MPSFPLQDLREMLTQEQIIFSIGQVIELSFAEDRSFLKCTCNILSDGDERHIIARVGWEAVGPDSGDFQIPAIGDLVIIAYIDDEVDMAFIIKRLTSMEDKIPQNAMSGDRVIKSLADKNIWVTGQGRVNITKRDDVPTENLVLGQELNTLLTDLIGQLDMVLTGLLAEPQLASKPVYMAAQTAINLLKTTKLDNQAILSDFAYTSKD